jgi:DNA-binding NarL/FixJ family response regulator
MAEARAAEPRATALAAATASEALRLAEDLAAVVAEDIRALAHRARLHLDPLASVGGSAPQLRPAPRIRLTGREREVLSLVAEGHSNGQIAARLYISPKTASVHVSNILSKLNAATRTEAAIIAHRMGLLAAD